jgi:hypothetical protein
MAPIQCVCPACNKVLKMTEAQTLPTKVQCPHCATKFLLTAGAVQTPGPAPQPAKRGGPGRLMLVGLTAGVLALGAGIALGLYFFSGKDDDSKADKPADKKDRAVEMSPKGSPKKLNPSQPDPVEPTERSTTKERSTSRDGSTAKDSSRPKDGTRINDGSAPKDGSTPKDTPTAKDSARPKDGEPEYPSTDPKKPTAPLIPHKNPDGPTGIHSLRVASTGNVILVTDRLTGKEVWRQSAAAPVVFLSFAPDSKTVISRDQKGETCTWDAATGKLVKREDPKKDTGAPKPPPVAPVAEKALDEEALRADLLKVKEVDLYPEVDKLRQAAIDASLTRKDLAQDEQLRRNFALISPPSFMAGVNKVLLKKAKEEGLPLQPSGNVRMTLSAARTMDAMSKELRAKGFVSVPGAAPAPVVSGNQGSPELLIKASAHASALQDWCKENRIERYPGALNTFLQMLQVEDDPTRMVLVDELGKVKDPVATRILASRAIFDLSPEIRKSAVESLKKRSPGTYRKYLVSKLRYPWAPAADHVAETLIALDDKKAIPELTALLNKPDPRLPVYNSKLKTGVVKEVVRINHMRNCFLCHTVSMLQTDLVRGAVPRPGQLLPQMYYNTAVADFVQADVTYLRQDFSVAQPVENATPWPRMQRYDYMVRTRKATDAEMAELRDSPSASYPQKNAVLTALRGLSGRDLGTSTEAWQKYAAGLAPTKATAEKEAGPKDNPSKDKPPKDSGTAEASKEEMQAAAKLKLAKMLQNDGIVDKAKVFYQEIIQDFPKTKAADEARAILKKLNQ